MKKKSPLRGSFGMGLSWKTLCGWQKFQKITGVSLEYSKGVSLRNIFHMRSKYCREYKGTDKDMRYFLVLDREGYIPIKYRRKVAEMGLERVSNEWICNCVTDYAVIKKPNGLYAAPRNSFFYEFGIGIKII